MRPLPKRHHIRVTDFLLQSVRLRLVLPMQSETLRQALWPVGRHVPEPPRQQYERRGPASPRMGVRSFLTKTHDWRVPRKSSNSRPGSPLLGRATLAVVVFVRFFCTGCAVGTSVTAAGGGIEKRHSECAADIASDPRRRPASFVCAAHADLAISTSTAGGSDQLGCSTRSPGSIFTTPCLGRFATAAPCILSPRLSVCLFVYVGVWRARVTSCLVY